MHKAVHLKKRVKYKKVKRRLKYLDWTNFVNYIVFDTIYKIQFKKLNFKINKKNISCMQL